MADTAPYKHGRFCWHEVSTRDAAKAKEFYAKLIGYETVDNPMPGGAEGTYTMLRMEGGDVAGLSDMGGQMPEGVPANWTGYVWVDDVDAAAAKAKELGGSELMGPMDVPGVGRMAMFQDPTGAAFGIYHGTGHMGAAQGITKGAVDWNELVCPDVEAAQRFYTGLFGWTAQRQDMGDSQYTVFMDGEEARAGMMPMEGDQWEGVPPHWMPYLTVPNCKDTVERAKSMGAQVLVAPMPASDVGTFAVLQDPTGAAFSVMEYDA